MSPLTGEVTGEPDSAWHQPACAAHLLPSAVTAAQKAPDTCSTSLRPADATPSQFFSTPSPRSATGSRVIQPQADRFSLVLAGALPLAVQIKRFHFKTSKTIREIPVIGAPGFKIKEPGFERDNRRRRLFVPVLRIGHMAFPHSNRSNFTAAAGQTAHGQTEQIRTRGEHSWTVRPCNVVMVTSESLKVYFLGNLAELQS